MKTGAKKAAEETTRDIDQIPVEAFVRADKILSNLNECAIDR